MRKLINFIALCFTILFVASVAVILYAVDDFSKIGPLKEDKTVIIADGSGLKTISRQLEKEGIINYGIFFELAVRLKKQDANLVAGEYLFPAAISPKQVLAKVSSGDIVIRKVTIAEGLMNSQIVEIINNIDALQGDITIQLNEGYLLPDTYNYKLSDSRDSVIEQMNRAMNKFLDQAWQERDPDIIVNTKEEALILASIVEKETSIAAERPRIAAVFMNRLRIGMRLQTDPSVIYGITNGQYKFDRKLYIKDLETPSPYNSYLNEGLPPTAIANPGRESILAVLKPIKTDELYFVANGEGGHSFAKTLKEHNENVLKWRNVQKEMQK